MTMLPTWCRRGMEVLGLALLHPTAEDEGDVGPSFARLLGSSRHGILSSYWYHRGLVVV